jgi:hypothetical protein
MKSLWKWLLVAVGLVVIAFGAFIISVERYHRSGLPAQERRAQEVTIQPLLQSHATREQVIQALGFEFVDYSSDSTNRWVLEQRVSIPEVRQAAKRYPVVLFHTTALTETWLFFDAEGRLQQYYLCEQ